jgi:hypothetical protein
MLQTLKSKFNQSEVDPTCPICRLETETITHVITSCPLYNEIRKEHFVSTSFWQSMTSWHIMSFLLKFIFQQSKPIPVITVPLIFTKCSFLISTHINEFYRVLCCVIHLIFLWNSINNSVRDVRKAITKARMLQTLKSKFNQSEVDPTCPICRLETETITHVITSCPLYNAM